MKRIAFLLLFTFSVAAQEAAPKPVVISGVVFGDYYTAVSHHDERVEGMNGFWIRRANVVFDRGLSEQLSARLRLEALQPGDFRTNATLETYIKDAYVRYRHTPALEVILGLSTAPFLETSERLWGYRAVERIPIDLHRLASTRDLGVAVLGTHGRMRYHVQAGNGAGLGSETNEGKKVSGSFGLNPTAATIVELYADFEDRPGATNRSTVQALAGFQNERFRTGAHYVRQMRDNADDFDVASLFGVWNLSPRFALLGRVDVADANPEGAQIAYLQLDPTRDSMLFIAGVDWKLHKNLSIIPNAELVTYEDGGDDDLFARVTFNFTF